MEDVEDWSQMEDVEDWSQMDVCDLRLLSPGAILWTELVWSNREAACWAFLRLLSTGHTSAIASSGPISLPSLFTSPKWSSAEYLWLLFAQGPVHAVRSHAIPRLSISTIPLIQLNVAQCFG